MNAAHAHLLIAHLPVLGTVFGLLLLLWAELRHSSELHRTSLGVFVLAALSAVPTYLTGQPASALLSKVVPGISMDAGDQHAEMAVIALVAVLVLGVLALSGLVLFRKNQPSSKAFTALTVVLAFVVAGVMIWTAILGGRIRHTEAHALALLSRGSNPPV